MAHRYYIDSISGEQIAIHGQDAVHISKVMRHREGDVIVLSDRQGHDYTAEIIKAGEDEVLCRMLEKRENPADPVKKLTVFMALPKGDKLEMIVQKCCELGAFRIVPFVSRYCVAQKSKKDQNKVARYNRISEEACKQCGRSIPMEVTETRTFREMLGLLDGYDRKVLFYEHGKSRLGDLDLSHSENAAIIIGSEGGFSEEEAAQMEQAGCDNVVLGHRILRCETAAIAATAMTMLLMGEME